MSLLLLAALGFISRPGGQTPVHRTTPVSRGDIDKSITCLGTLQPVDYVDVGAQVSGQLKQVLVEIGDRVEEGQLLAVIDSSSYESRVEEDRAEIASLQAQLSQAQAELALARLQNERNIQLRSLDFLSQSELDASASVLAVAQAKIASIEAQIRKAQSALAGDLTDLKHTKIHAPMSGMVIDQTTLEGETINANQAAPKILRIANVQTMTVETEVAEADIVLIKPGMTAWFTILGLSGRRWEGSVRQILPTPETKNDVVLYKALIDAPNSAGILMTEMTAQVYFILEKARNALLAPLSAVRWTDGRAFLDILDKGQVRQVPVETGVQGRTEIEITSGVREGDLIVLGQTEETSTQRQEQGPPRMMGPRL